MSENGEADRPGDLSRRWMSLVTRARRGVAGTQNSQGGVEWRILMLGISALGSLATVGCLLTGHWMFGGRLFLATLLVLAVLLLQAVL